VNCRSVLSGIESRRLVSYFLWRAKMLFSLPDYMEVNEMIQTLLKAPIYREIRGNSAAQDLSGISPVPGHGIEKDSDMSKALKSSGPRRQGQMIFGLQRA
jgi:hypothetical protein